MKAIINEEKCDNKDPAPECGVLFSYWFVFVID